MRTQMKRTTPAALATGLCLAMSACNSSSGASADPGSTQTVLANGTAQAVLTELAVQTAVPTSTLATVAITLIAPSATATPTPTITTVVYSATSESSCDMAGFVKDVTIADGTEIEAGASFTKTWRLRNDGTCTWDSDYDVVFYSGDSMDGDESFSLTDDEVAPGETVDISVDMVAPEDAGEVLGYWLLRNASGTLFGVGSARGSFYVDITVVEAGSTSTATVTSTPSTATATTAPTATPETPTATPEPATETPAT